MFPTKTKVLSIKQAVKWRAGQRRKGLTVAFTNGCFDILHRGHVRIIESARKTADSLIIGLNSDASVKRLKGPERPLNSQDDRAVVLAALAAVDRVVIFQEDTPLELLSALKPDVLVKGADYSHEKIVGREFAGKTVRVPLVKNRSTTLVISKMRKNAKV
ncbi:MAG: adenylyltransferase/cytidyltransferase family protein [Elusimicrobiaceae bacterium]|jgi:D-beta-D-heptose 7-phosphate kinase/D-beta-D-heptose 1-phosphate adenosyltransferase